MYISYRSQTKFQPELVSCGSSGSSVGAGAVPGLLRPGWHEARAVRPALRRCQDASGRRLSQPLHAGAHGATEDAASQLPPHDEDAREHGGLESGGHEARRARSRSTAAQQPETPTAAPAPGPAGQSRLSPQHLLLQPTDIETWL